LIVLCRLVKGFGEMFSLRKETEFGSFPSDLIDISRDEVGDHLDGDTDPQTVRQVVKSIADQGLSLLGRSGSATSARLLSTFGGRSPMR
jgi:hypothetical protein